MICYARSWYSDDLLGADDICQRIWVRDDWMTYWELMIYVICKWFAMRGHDTRMTFYKLMIHVSSLLYGMWICDIWMMLCEVVMLRWLATSWWCVWVGHLLMMYLSWSLYGMWGRDIQMTSTICWWYMCEFVRSREVSSWYLDDLLCEFVIFSWLTISDDMKTNARCKLNEREMMWSDDVMMMSSSCQLNEREMMWSTCHESTSYHDVSISRTDRTAIGGDAHDAAVENNVIPVSSFEWFENND